MKDNPELTEFLQRLETDPTILDNLTSQLVWRIGQVENTDYITIRVGFASRTAEFANLPRLKNISDQELEKAMQAKNVRVEWID